ncbi:hypothetical protein [Rhizomonospora bruguierae]|uniref:hypothetical protein n=1 Tax=Rhizomonospora bruguierae TaxID=1581705 RepID=UPI001BCF2597|nr:hypothetical protein [Micromonospora sp. NBRC 107566]
MTAVLRDIVVEQGATFEFMVDLLDENEQRRTDLAGYTGAMQIRERPDATTVLATATVSVDASNAQVTATIPAAITTEFDWTAGVYDLEITNGARTERIAQGKARLSREVTR